MKKLNYIFLFCCYLLLINNATAQNTDNEKLQNAKHALDAYNDCQTALNNLNDISAAGQGQKEYLLCLGKAYECKGDYEQAKSYYNKILVANPGDQGVKDRIAHMKEQKEIQQKTDEDFKQHEKEVKREEEERNQKEQELILFKKKCEELVGVWNYTSILGAKKELNIFLINNSIYPELEEIRLCVLGESYSLSSTITTDTDEHGKHFLEVGTVGAGIFFLRDVYANAFFDCTKLMWGEGSEPGARGKLKFSDDFNTIFVYLPDVVDIGQTYYPPKKFHGEIYCYPKFSMHISQKLVLTRSSKK